MQQAAWRMVTVLGVALSTQAAYADKYGDASQLATERESAGQLDAAAEALEEISAEYSQDLGLQLRMAWLRFRAGSYQRALRHYQEAYRLSPPSVDARLGLGWTLLRLGRCDDARPYFAGLLAQNPQHTVAKEGLTACPLPPRLLVTPGALLTGMAYSGHYLRLGGVAVSPRLELVIDGKWLIGAAYRYSDFFLKPTTTATNPVPPIPPFPRFPPMMQATTTTTQNRFAQNEAYFQFGYVGSRLGLLARYAFLVDSRGISESSHHVGLGLRVSALGEAQLQLAASVYSDLTIVRAAPTWRLPIGKGFSVQVGGVGQYASGSLLGSGNLELSFVRGPISIWAGGSYGEQLRPAQLEIMVITNMSERIAASAWGSIAFRLPYRFGLLLDYRYDRLRRLPDVRQSTESNANYITLGLSKAF
ncbi:MAG: tetratricopeptide repeat protein [Myxococcales bacterium]|nr:tetratricopeptide repeat protein [Myxococcales bacterium]